MNNSQLNHFSKVPVDMDIRRSLFERPQRVLTTMNTGQLVPLFFDEILPGDTVKVDMASLVRMATPLHPVMDNAFLDVHFYFCPMRLTWEHAKNFFGENTASPWIPSVSYTIPQISIPTSGGDGVYNSTVAGFAKGTLGSYLTGTVARNSDTISALPFRAYCLIWNNYYRDQNVFSPVNVSLGDSTTTGSNAGVAVNAGVAWTTGYNSYINNGTYVTAAQTGAALLPVCRFHDAFSSVLPGPQKGPSVTMPLGTLAPIVNDTSLAFSGVSPAWYTTATGSSAATGYAVATSLGTGNSTYTGTTPSNMYTHLAADLSNATAATVNQLRNAFMVQRFYEKLARGGSRYFEMIKAFFDVRVPDATVQIPEFLGGKRIPINITQVAQTSATDDSLTDYTPLGSLSAYSLTTDTESDVFAKSFTEHGFLFAVCCIRTEHSYSQGMNRYWFKKTLTDFYLPTFANAPEQPVYTRELYVTGTSSDSTVFGYQEAWYEYRYSPTIVSGEFNVDFAQALDSYHYGDDYSAAPSLSPGWLREPQLNVARTLAVKSHDQFLCDFLFNNKWVRAMPVYSVPGLLDHH